MLLTLTTTHRPATDLGYLLCKNPSRPQTVELSFGKAHVYYPEAADDRCTAALQVEIDPVGLVRNRRGPAGDNFALEQYVNDRPYVASSFLSVALANTFGTALSGISRDRPALAKTPIPLVATISVLSCRSGEPFLRSLFEPLGYAVTIVRHPLDETFAEWGESHCYTVTLSQTVTLHDLLTHLYVLVPVLDNDKHYWIGSDETEKLLRHGDPWLAAHPQKEAIVSRYLLRRRELTTDALRRLVDVDAEQLDDESKRMASEEELVEAPISLNEHRHNTVLAVLKSCGARTVLDLGCSYGTLTKRLLEEKTFTRVVGVDVSHRALEIAARRLRLDRMPERQRGRVDLWHGSITYRDARLTGFDAAVVVEVIEHLDVPRLAGFERAVFEFARPATVVVTTPNIEFNVRFATLATGTLRHRDHRFEWTRSQFQEWARRVAGTFGYGVRFVPVGLEDAEVGPATQLAVFSRSEASRSEPSSVPAAASPTDDAVDE